MKAVHSLLLFALLCSASLFTACQKDQDTAPEPIEKPAEGTLHVKLKANIPTYFGYKWNVTVGIAEVGSYYYTQKVSSTSDWILLRDIAPGSYVVECRGTVEVDGTLYQVSGDLVAQVQANKTTTLTFNFQ